MKTTFCILILASGACFAADGLTPLDVKTGLWETTTTTERSGMPTISADQLAKMPADVRARVQGMSAPHTETKQSCMTRDEVSKFGLNQDKSCKITTVTSTGSKQEFQFDCDSAQSKSTGTMKIEAVDSSHVNSLIVIKMNSSNGRNMDMKITNSAKWLATDCGNVKPASDKKE
jgi:hypothetical protein